MSECTVKRRLESSVNMSSLSYVPGGWRAVRWGNKYNIKEGDLVLWPGGVSKINHNPEDWHDETEVLLCEKI